MRGRIIRKKMQKVVPKTRVQITGAWNEKSLGSILLGLIVFLRLCRRQTIRILVECILVYLQVLQWPSCQCKYCQELFQQKEHRQRLH